MQCLINSCLPLVSDVNPNQKQCFVFLLFIVPQLTIDRERKKIIFCFLLFLVAQLTEQNHRLTSELQACLSREEELQTRISQLRDQVCDKVRNVP